MHKIFVVQNMGVLYECAQGVQLRLFEVVSQWPAFHTSCPSRAGMACKMLLCCSRLLHSLVLCRVVAISCGPYVQLQLAFVQLPARAYLPGGFCTLALCMYR